MIKLFTLILVLIATSAWPATYTVHPDGPPTYDASTITGGLALAGNGDTVEVYAGTYAEQITISHDTTVVAHAGDSPLINGLSLWETMGENDNLVTITADGATLDGINVYKSRGRCICISGADNVTIQNLTASYAYAHNLFIYNQANDNTVTNCTFHHGVTKRDEKESGDDIYYRSNVAISLYSLRNVISNCVIRDSYHEGLDIIKGSENNIIRDNLIFSNRRVQVYFDRSRRNLIEDNIIYAAGTVQDSETGIEIRHESPAYTGYGSFEIIRNNYIANTSHNFWIATVDPTSTPYTPQDVTGIHFFHNTSIWATTRDVLIYQPNISTTSDTAFKNNIIWMNAGTTLCQSDDTGTYDYNFWSTTPDSDLQGTNDPTPYSAPSLVKSTGWDSIQAYELTKAHFAQLQGSKSINNGDFLTTVTGKAGDILTVTDAGFFHDGWSILGETGDTIYDDDGYSAVITDIDYDNNKITISGDDKAQFTATDQITIVHYVDHPDIGANEYGSPIQNSCPVCKIDSPSGDLVIADGNDVDFQATCTDADSDSMTYEWFQDGISIYTDGEDLGLYGDVAWSDNTTYVITMRAYDGKCYSDITSSTRRIIEVGSPTSTTITFGENSGDTHQSGHADNSIWEGGATQNNGSRDYMWIGPSAGSDADEGLLAFNLANADGLTGTDCEVCVTIYDPPSSAHTLTLYANQDAWTELGSNWNTYDGTNAWTGTRGQNGSKATVSSGTVDEAEICFKHADLLTYVNSCAGGMCRFSITGSVDDDKLKLYTREAETDGKRPYLKFTYGEPTGNDPVLCWFESDGPFKAGDTVNAYFKYPVGVTVSFTTDGDGTPYEDFETGASDIRLTLQTPSGEARNTHKLTGTVLAGMNSSDLTPKNLALQLEGWTISGDETADWPDSPNRFQDQSDCVIDTTAIDFSAGTFFYCDVDMVQIDAPDPDYVTIDETCYLCLQTNGSQDIYYTGKLTDVKIDTNLNPAANSEWHYHALSGDIIQFARTVVAGDRAIGGLEAAGVAEETGLLHGSTVLSDLVGNTTVYTLPQVTPDGSQINIDGYDTYYIGSLDGDYTSYANLISAIGGLVPGDAVYFAGGEDFEEAVVVSQSGTSGEGYITIGSYGSGYADIITPKTAISSGTWHQVGSTDVWYMDIDDPDWVGQVFENIDDTVTPMKAYRTEIALGPREFGGFRGEDVGWNESAGNGSISYTDVDDLATMSDTTEKVCVLTKGADANTYIYVDVSLTTGKRYFLSYGAKGDTDATGALRVFRAGPIYMQDDYTTWNSNNNFVLNTDDANAVLTTTETTWTRKHVELVPTSTTTHRFEFYGAVDTKPAYLDDVFIFSVDDMPAGYFSMVCEPDAGGGDVRLFVHLNDSAEPSNASGDGQVSYYNTMKVVDLTNRNYVKLENLNVYGSIVGDSGGNHGYITLEDINVYYGGGCGQGQEGNYATDTERWLGSVNFFASSGNYWTGMTYTNVKSYYSNGIGIRGKRWTDTVSNTLTGCEVYNYAYSHCPWPGGIYITDCDDVTITSAIVDTCGDDGVDIGGYRSNGIWSDENGSGTTVTRCLVKNINGCALHPESADDGDWYYNIANGCLWGAKFGGGQEAHGNDFYNNTILNVQDCGSDEGIGLVFYDQDSGTTNVKNNIIGLKGDSATEKYVYLHANFDGTLNLDYNCYDSTNAPGENLGFEFEGADCDWDDWPTNSSQDSHSIHEDPLFRSVTNEDYHLQGNSPCIDTGTDVGLSSDYAGRPVPRRAAQDMGAYEYSGYRGKNQMGLGIR